MDRRAHTTCTCSQGIPVSVQQKDPPDKETNCKISFDNTESGAGLQSLLLGRMAKAHVKGVVLFTDTGMTTRSLRCDPARAVPAALELLVLCITNSIIVIVSYITRILD